MPWLIFKIKSIEAFSSSILNSGIISEKAKPLSAKEALILEMPFSNFFTLYQSLSLTGIKFLKLIFGRFSTFDCILIDEILYLFPSFNKNRIENPLLSGKRSPCFFKTLNFIKPRVK